MLETEYNDYCMASIVQDSSSQVSGVNYTNESKSIALRNTANVALWRCLRLDSPQTRTISNISFSIRRIRRSDDRHQQLHRKPLRKVEWFIIERTNAQVRCKQPLGWCRKKMVRQQGLMPDNKVAASIIVRTVHKLKNQDSLSPGFRHGCTTGQRGILYHVKTGNWADNKVNNTVGCTGQLLQTRWCTDDKNGFIHLKKWTRWLSTEFWTE
jgi:hypothetical protein